MQDIQKLLEQSIEDFSISRSERKELKAALTKISGQTTEQAKARQLAFQMATKVISEIGELAAMEWLEGVIKLIYAKENKVTSSAYFSPGEDCLHRIRRLISEAQHSLDICVFTITDNRIVEKIIEAHRRGIAIRIISDDDKSEDLGSDMERLEQSGINCIYDATSAHMHHKFAIADGHTLLNGSFNWTRSATTANSENILVTNNPKLVTKYAAAFDKLWDQLSD
ncbi:MAG: cardiolipin hydrolase [Cryomorphaceae bacterium]|jgi:cardiolipin hydrolase